MREKEQTSGALPMSQCSYLYQAMSTMTSYAIAMQDQWLKQMIKQAEVVGGFSEDKQGNVHIDLNADGSATGGTTGNFLSLSFAAAEESGAAIRDEAKSAIVQAASSGAGLIGTGVAYKMTTNAQLAHRLSDAQEEQKVLLATPQNGQIVLQNQAVDADRITNKVNAMAGGDKSAFENYKKDENGNLLPQTVQDENRAVIQQASASPQRNAIARNLDKYIEKLQQQINIGSQQLNTWTNIISQVVNLGTASGNAAFKSEQAADQRAATSDTARSQVAQTNLQQQNTYTADAKQKADTFFQDAAAIAMGYGQIVNTHA